MQTSFATSPVTVQVQLLDYFVIDARQLTQIFGLACMIGFVPTQKIEPLIYGPIIIKCGI